MLCDSINPKQYVTETLIPYLGFRFGEKKNRMERYDGLTNI